MTATVWPSANRTCTVEIEAKTEAPSEWAKNRRAAQDEARDALEQLHGPVAKLTMTGGQEGKPNLRPHRYGFKA